MSEIVGTATDDNFKTEVEDAKLPTLVDFWAAWCGPCRAIAPIVEDLAKENAGRLKVMKMDVDSNPQVPMRFNITGIPTVLLFKNGRSSNRRSARRRSGVSSTWSRSIWRSA